MELAISLYLQVLDQIFSGVADAQLVVVELLYCYQLGSQKILTNWLLCYSSGSSESPVELPYCYHLSSVFRNTIFVLLNNTKSIQIVGFAVELLNNY
jgi:hypothetical protein